MPIDEEYGPQIHSSNADLQNVSLDFFLLMDEQTMDSFFFFVLFRPVVDQQGAALLHFS